MSIFLYFRYFLNSVRLRGLKNTLILLRREMKYDAFFGINTKKINSKQTNDYYHYQGSSYFALFKVFEEIKKYNNEFDFFDIGCGKARALIVAEYYGFKKLFGIDLDAELISAAERNVSERKFKKPETVFTIQTANALKFRYNSSPTIYFLFNPFGKQVLYEVVKKIMEQNKGKKKFVYLNPIHKEVFEELGFTKEIEIKTNKYLEAIIYA